MNIIYLKQKQNREICVIYFEVWTLRSLLAMFQSFIADLRILLLIDS